MTIAVFAQGQQARDAEAAGADFVGGDDLAKKVEEGWTDFDVAIATPQMMPTVGKLGRVLGPQGKMPNPKVGTVTDDVEKAVTESKAGKVEYRTDRQAIIHLAIGKASFEQPHLLDNYTAVIEEIVRAKPSAAKGRYILSVTLTTTMGPGVRVDSAKAGERGAAADAGPRRLLAEPASRPRRRRPTGGRGRPRLESGRPWSSGSAWSRSASPTSIGRVPSTRRWVGAPAAIPDADVAFFQAGGMALALWSRPRWPPTAGSRTRRGGAGHPAHNVRTPAEVDAVIEQARAAGAAIPREPGETFWGGYSGVFADPDGHPWEVAHNPRWTIGEDGSVIDLRPEDLAPGPSIRARAIARRFHVATRVRASSSLHGCASSSSSRQVSSACSA